jgi:hypothetical protein
VECRLTWRQSAVDELLEIRLPAGDN